MDQNIMKMQQVQLEALKQAQKTLSPELEPVVDHLVRRIVDKWSLTVLEVLGEQGLMRFTKIARAIPDISQKMLTQTLKRMERDGLVVRTVHPVIPPHVDYQLTALGMELGLALCGVWLWAARNVGRVESARRAFDFQQEGTPQ